MEAAERRAERWSARSEARTNDLGARSGAAKMSGGVWAEEGEVEGAGGALKDKGRRQGKRGEVR